MAGRSSNGIFGGARSRIGAAPCTARAAGRGGRSCSTRRRTRTHSRTTPAERQDAARKLEAIREDLAPMFELFEARGLPRADVAAMWAFTTTIATELAMDKDSQRMPL